MKRRIIENIIIFSVLLFILAGCGIKNEKNIDDKVNTELRYVEDLVFKIANKYAKEEYLEDNEFKWEYVKDDVSRINDAWSTLVLDLTEKNVSKENIINFSDDLSNLLISVSNKDDITLLEKLNRIYSEIITFREECFDNKNDIEKNKIKNKILAIYILVNKNDYETAKLEMSNLIEKYKKLMRDSDYVNENGYNLNKIYILLEEYENSIKIQNLDLIRMRYINVVEEV